MDKAFPISVNVRV